MMLDVKTRDELLVNYGSKRYVVYEEEKGGIWLGDIVRHNGEIKQAVGITTGGPAVLNDLTVVWRGDVEILNRVVRDEGYEEYLQRTGEWRS